MEENTPYASATDGPPMSDLKSGTLPTWTYPNRMCRICLEEVRPTLTFYPPGVPERFQRAVIEYKSEDEGRLVKPCRCRGSLRYIHEQCLTRLRTESARPGSLWKCHQCGYSFNFNRLNIQKILSSKIASGLLTVVVMMIIMFFLGFVADPIINLYEDPYYTITYGEYWDDVVVVDSDGPISAWSAHFLKGLVSMGFIGFAKVIVLQPWHWWNLRNSGLVGGRGRPSSTGRDRVNQVQWIAVVIGVASAFYFFYRWVQSIIGRSLTRIGNSIVDTHLPGDDEDLKPPPGWSAAAAYPPKPEATTVPSEPVEPSSMDEPSNAHLHAGSKEQVQSTTTEPTAPVMVSSADVGDDSSTNPKLLGQTQAEELQPRMNGRMRVPTGTADANTLNDSHEDTSARSSALDSAQQQNWSWSFAGT